MGLLQGSWSDVTDLQEQHVTTTKIHVPNLTIWASLKPTFLRRIALQAVPWVLAPGPKNEDVDKPPVVDHFPNQNLEHLSFNFLGK